MGDKQFVLVSNSNPFGSGSPKVRATSSRAGSINSSNGPKKSVVCNSG
jgi:hypothetical protein